MGKTSKKVLEKIKEEEIQIIPKWKFMLKESFVKILFIVNIFWGSVGFGIILYLLLNNDVFEDKSLTNSLVEKIVFGIPFAWILLTLFFVFVAYYNFKNTQEGYRYNVIKILLLGLFISCFLGTILYFTKLSERLNTLFVKNVPYYIHTMDMRSRVWMRPQEGFLAGEIKSVNMEQKIIELIDLEGNIWKIYFQDSVIKIRVELEKSEEIKIIGRMSSEGIFEAFEIRPWEGSGRKMQESR